MQQETRLMQQETRLMQQETRLIQLEMCTHLKSNKKLDLHNKKLG